MEEVENKYCDERDDLVRQTFQAAFSDVVDAYSFLLHVLFTSFFDLYSKRIPINFYALDEFDIWLDLMKTNGKVVPEPMDCHKSQSMEFICRSGYNYLDKINKIFKLDQGDNSFLANLMTQIS